MNKAYLAPIILMTALGAYGADVVQWSDVQRKLDKDCACIITVITKDGTQHEAFDYLPADDQGVQFSRTLLIPRESIVEIRIQPEILPLSRVREEVKEFWDEHCDPKCGIGALWVVPTAAGITGILRPTLWVVNGIRRLTTPNKLIRLAP